MHVTEEDFQDAMEEAKTDQNTFPDEVRPGLRSLAVRNHIRENHGGSLGDVESVELVPQQVRDGIKYTISVTHRKGKRTIPNDILMMAGHAGLDLHPTGEDPVDSDDEDERLTYTLR